MTISGQPVTLRERKKLQTYEALADTAVSLFGERGFDDTPLDALLDEVAVSRRTFFRNFRSKEDVALTAVKELWSAYLDVLDQTEKSGPLNDVFRDAVLVTIDRMDEHWYGRFAGSLRLIEQSAALEGHSLRYCAEMQDAIADRLGDPHRLELRLALEFCVATWRCALDDWLPDCTPSELSSCVRRAFATMDDAIRVQL